jgi:hypothetical protein
VVVYTGTSLATADINEIITDVEGEVVDEVVSQGGAGDATSHLLKAAVKFLVKAEILEREIQDGTKVKSHNGGPTYESVDPTSLRNEAAKKIVSYIQKHGGIYTTSSVSMTETIVRKDNKMPDGHLDQSSVKEYHDKADEVNSEDSDFEEV